MSITAERLRIDVEADTRQARRNLDAVSGSGGGQSRGLRGISKAAGMASLAVAGAAAAVGAAGAAGLGFGVKVAAGNEQAMISFTTMLGSAQKAGKFLKELQAFAAKTPFEFPELQTAAASLISAGFEAKKVIPIMTTLGDVTSGMGTGSEGVRRATVALQQMSAAGRITGEDLNQLRDAGVPVFDLLSSATRKSKEAISAMAQAGKLGKKEMEALFKALGTGNGLERFNGLMEKQAVTLTGLWSTFKDTLGQGLAKAVQPLIPLLKDGLGGAAEFLATSLPKLSTWMVDSGVPAFKDFAAWIGDEVLPRVKDLGGYIISDVVPNLKSFGTYLMTNVVPTLQSFSDVLTTYGIPALQGLLALVGPIVRAFAGLPGPVQLGAAAFVALGVAASAAGPKITALQAKMAAAAAAGGVGALRAGMSGLIGMMGGPWGVAVAAAGAVLVTWASQHAAAKRRVDELATSLNVATGAITKQTRASVVDSLEKAGVLKASRELGLSLKDVTDAALGNEAAQKRVTKATNDMALASVAGGRMSGGAAVELSRNLNKVTGAIDGTNKELDAARAKLSRATEAMNDMGGSAFTAGVNFSTGLAAGIRKGTGAAVEAARQTASKVTGMLEGRNGFDTHSPSRVTERLGRNIGQGLINGMTGSEAGIESAAERVIETVNKAFAKTKTTVDNRVVGIINEAKGDLTAHARHIESLTQSFERIRSQVIGSGELAGLGARQGDDGATLAPTAGTIAEDLQARVANAATFAQNLATLASQKLNKQALADLAAAGAAQGGAAAQALVDAGKAAVAQINNLHAQLTSAATATAKVGSAAMYDAGVLAAQGLAAGFASQRKAIQATMRSIARAMRDEIRKALDERSPSRVMAEVGRLAGVGLQQGLESTLRPVAATAGRLGLAAIPDNALSPRRSQWQPGNVPADGPTPGSGPAIGQVIFQESFMSPAEQANALTWALTTRGR